MDFQYLERAARGGRLCGAGGSNATVGGYRLPALPGALRKTANPGGTEVGGFQVSVSGHLMGE